MRPKKDSKKTNKTNRKTLIAVLGIFIFLIGLLISINLKNSFTTINKSISQLNVAKSGLMAWGSNSYGQLGVDFAKSQDPIAININEVQNFSAGQNHSIVLTKSGQVLSWGNNHYGQLGFPTQKLYIYNPTLIEGFSDIRQIAANSNHSLLLKKDGTIWAFGNNFTGQLGNGTNINSSTPVQVLNIDHVNKIAAGYKFSVAIKDDQTLWAWGTSCDPDHTNQAQQLLENFANNLAALQNGYYDSGSSDSSLSGANQSEDCLNEDIIGIKSKVPKQIQGLDHVQDVSGGYGHVLVLKNDGTVWSFGCNHYEQLGQTPDLHSLANATPKQIQNLPDIMQVFAGFRHSLVLTKNGEVYAWGHNQFGELGQGVTGDNNPLPTKVEGLSDVVAISAGFDYSLAIKKDGTIWGWGTNNFKQLGKDANPIETRPVQIKNIKNIASMAAGGAHVLVLTN